MLRLFALLTLVCFVPNAIADDLTPIEKQLAIQNAMARARQYLKVEMPVEAVEVLETEITKADGNMAFLVLLKQAYLSELAFRMKDPTRNAERLNQLRRNIDLLVGSKPATASSTTPSALPTSATNNAESTSAPATPIPAPSIPEPPPHPSAGLPNIVPDSNSAADAATAFKNRDYVQAERLFALIGAAKLNTDQKAAWAYCRISLAAGKVNAPQCDPATANAAEKDVAEAIKLVPQHAELQKIGQQVIAAANLKANSRDGAATQTGPSPDWITKPTVASTGDFVETASFRVRYSGNRELAETVAKAAEKYRKDIFERWTGPAGGAWEQKCEIVIHASAEVYSQATGRPAGSSGTAIVRLSNGRASERRIDLRADDAELASNALPRELTHIVLADLFPDKPPPKWAEEGMAVLSGSAEEAGRYTSTLRRCARDGEWFGLIQLTELKDFPADKITGFYCESVSLTEYLIHMRGERNFTIFLRDCQRYGTAQALKRQYGIDNPQSLEAAWKRSALEVTRGQAP